MFPFIAANYFFAKRTDRAAQRLGKQFPVGSSGWYAAGAVLAVLATIATLGKPITSDLAVSTVAQLIIAVLLTVRPPRTSS